MAREPKLYLGAAQLGAALSEPVSRSAVTKWRERHGQGSAHPFPPADVQIGDTPGWLPSRVAQVERWRAGLPGRGAGGGRPRRQPE